MRKRMASQCEQVPFLSLTGLADGSSLEVRAIHYYTENLLWIYPLLRGYPVLSSKDWPIVSLCVPFFSCNSQRIHQNVGRLYLSSNSSTTHPQKVSQSSFHS